MYTNILLALFTILIPRGASTEEVLVVDEPRPVVAAIRILEERYGWLINYEDPKYGSEDLVDRTSPAYRGEHRALDPRGGRLEFRYPVSENTQLPLSQVSVLEILLSENERRGYPGKFVVTTVGGHYSVMPRDGSILDTIISLPDQERSYEEAVREIVAALSGAVGVPVNGPSMFRPRQERYTISAKGEPARDVLVRLFAQVEGYELRWHILYSPNWGYVLNIDGKKLPDPAVSPRRYITKEMTLPDGSKGRIPVPARPE
jgi:hypothetical protein